MLFKDKGASGEAEDDEDVFVVEDPSTGENLGAVKPWRAAIYAPTAAAGNLDCSPPDDTLELSWVYGFRGFDTRRAALWAGSGQRVVYPAAAVVVVYNLERHTQTYFRQHTDDVLGVAVHRCDALSPVCGGLTYAVFPCSDLPCWRQHVLRLTR